MAVSLELFLSYQTKNIILTNNTRDILYNINKIFCIIRQSSFAANICHNPFQTLKLKHKLLHHITLFSHDHQFIQTSLWWYFLPLVTDRYLLYQSVENLTFLLIMFKNNSSETNFYQLFKHLWNACFIVFRWA